MLMFAPAPLHPEARPALRQPPPDGFELSIPGNNPNHPRVIPQPQPSHFGTGVENIGPQLDIPQEVVYQRLHHGQKLKPPDGKHQPSLPHATIPHQPSPEIFRQEDISPSVHLLDDCLRIKNMRHGGQAPRSIDAKKQPQLLTEAISRTINLTIPHALQRLNPQQLKDVATIHGDTLHKSTPFNDWFKTKITQLRPEETKAIRNLARTIAAFATDNPNVGLDAFWNKLQQEADDFKRIHPENLLLLASAVMALLGPAFIKDKKLKRNIYQLEVTLSLLTLAACAGGLNLPSVQATPTAEYCLDLNYDTLSQCAEQTAYSEALDINALSGIALSNKISLQAKEDMFRTILTIDSLKDHPQVEFWVYRPNKISYPSVFMICRENSEGTYDTYFRIALTRNSAPQTEYLEGAYHEARHMVLHLERFIQEKQSCVLSPEESEREELETEYWSAYVGGAARELGYTSLPLENILEVSGLDRKGIVFHLLEPYGIKPDSELFKFLFDSPTWYHAVDILQIDPGDIERKNAKEAMERKWEHYYPSEEEAKILQAIIDRGMVHPLLEPFLQHALDNYEQLLR